MKYLGIDWGLKKIGLAISEGNLASPLESIKISGLEDGVMKILKIAKEKKIEMIVIGKPEGEMGKKVGNAVRLLQQSAFKIIVADETLSTQKAQQVMMEMGLSQKSRKIDDAMSAALILQQFLDEQ